MPRRYFRIFLPLAALLLSLFPSPSLWAATCASPDWQTVTTPWYTTPLSWILWTGSRFVATTATQVFESPDGAAWSKTADQGKNVNHVTAAGPSLVGVVSQGGWPPVASFVKSDDGGQWRVTATGSYGIIAGMAGDAGRLVAVGMEVDNAPVTGSLGAIAVSTDGGESWTARTLDFPSLSSIAWNGSQFVAVGRIGIIISSPDGSAWTEHPIPGLIDDLELVFWDGARFLIPLGQGEYLESRDAVDWSRHSFKPAKTIKSYARASSEYLAIAQNADYTTSLISSPEGNIWGNSDLVLSGTTSFKVVGNGEVLLVAGANGSLSRRCMAAEGRAPLAGPLAVQTMAGVAVSGRLPGADWRGAPLLFSVVTPPSYGTLTIDDPASGAFTYTPTAPLTQSNGKDAFTFKVNNGSLNSVAATVSVGIAAFNNAPTISAIPDTAITAGAASAPLPFVIGDVETPLDGLLLSASSSNPGLAPAGRITFGGTGASRQLTVTPVPGLSGETVITVTVSDAGGLSASTAFRLQVDKGDSAAPPLPRHHAVPPRLSASGTFSAVLRPDGTVWAWGANALGQLGNGTRADSTLPVRVAGLGNVADLAAGATHGLAARSDGTVWAWGGNSVGQLGNGGNTDAVSAGPVPGLVDIVRVAAGQGHSLALQRDGTVWAWGANDIGQLGDGSQTSQTAPVRVKGLSGVSAIAAGGNHSLALKADGTVWAWGANAFGQLGDGFTENRTQPVQVLILSEVTAVSGGGQHSVALKADGTVWAWGDNTYGQLGDSLYEDYSPKYFPNQVFSFTGAAGISAGFEHTMVMKADGTVWAFGRNNFRQWADGSVYAYGKIPQRAALLTDVRQVIASQGCTLGLKQDGTIVALGDNALGQLGDGTTSQRSAPVPVRAASGPGSFNVHALVTPKVAATFGHTLALRADGTVWAWGSNSYGQLGDGTRTDRSRPVQVQGLNGIRDVAAGATLSLALAEDGQVWAWGQNLFGSLGDGTEEMRLTPVLVPGLSDVTALSSHWYHSLALKADGTVWGWGQNAFGRLGDGTFTFRRQPVRAVGLSRVKAIAAGELHSLALKEDGTVWGWGYHYDKQLANMPISGSQWAGVTVPMQIPGIADAVAIDAYEFASQALRANGTVLAWGNQYYGQIPMPVNNLSEVTQASLGVNQDTDTQLEHLQGIALKGNGTVWAWWDNNWGNAPRQIAGLADVTAIKAGKAYYLALLRDGSIWSWGTNSQGQLGDGTLIDSTAPVQVMAPSGSGAFQVNTHANYAPEGEDGLFATTEGVAAGGRFAAQDADDDGLIFSIAANGDKGTAVLIDSATGAFVYTPRPDTVGQDQIVFQVSDGKLTSKTATMRVSILDNLPPAAQVSVPGSSYNLAQQVELLCHDTSGCAAIHYTVDGSEPDGLSAAYQRPLAINANTTVRFFAIDKAGNASAVQTARYIIEAVPPSLAITVPVNGKTIDHLTLIKGTASDPESGVGSVSLQITDGTFYVNAARELTTEPAWVMATLSPSGEWELNVSQVNWEPGATYTITARAQDMAGNHETVQARFVFYAGGQAYSVMHLELSSQAILQQGLLGVAGKLTRLPDNGTDLGGLAVTVTITGPNRNDAYVTETYDQYGHFQLRDIAGFDQKGNYTLTAGYAETPMLAASSASGTVLVGASSGYAVIVEGKVPGNEGLDSHNKTASRIYRHFLARGFRPEDIRYFNFDATQDGVFAVPTLAGVQNAIETWAKERMNSVPAPLYLVMVDHGSADTFYLGTETVTAAALNSWLASLEAGLGEAARRENRAVILGACYSGSFLPELSKPGRVIVTSAASDEVSYKGVLEPDNVRVGEFFLEELFRELGSGKSLRDSFRAATAGTEAFTRTGGAEANAANQYFDDARQHPLLDDNGDAVGTNYLADNQPDGRVAAGIYLGTGLTNELSSPADFTQVTETVFLAPDKGTATLWGKVADNAKVASAWVEVRSPAMILSARNSTGQVEVPLDKQFMTYIPVFGSWFREYGQFTEAGTYEVNYLTRDVRNGTLSPMRKSVVYKGKPDNHPPSAFSLTSPADSQVKSTVLVFDWQDAADPDGDAVSYTLTIARDRELTDVVHRQERLRQSAAYVDASAGLADLSTYYWKVEAIDQFGAKQGSSEAWKFSTDNTNGQPGFLMGIVYSSLDFSRLTAAAVSLNGTAPLVVNADGSFILESMAGTIVLEVTAEGYRMAQQVSPAVVSGQVSEVTVAMRSTLPAGTVSLDGAAERTNRPFVTLRLTANDSVASVQIRNGGGEWTASEPFAALKPWALSSGDGEKTVEVRFGDAGGHWSAPCSVSIVMDSRAPVTTASPAGAVYAGPQRVSLVADEQATIFCTTNGSEPTEDSPVCAGPIDITESTLLRFFAKDAAGNLERASTERYTVGLPGDCDRDGQVSLADAIAALQVVSGKARQVAPHLSADVNGDHRIGLEEVGFILREVAGR